MATHGKHVSASAWAGSCGGARNSPVAYNRILSGKQFWDGRAESLEDQAKGPIANPIEMSNTHEVCVHTVDDIPGYRLQFKKIFPDGITIDNVAKAIASFERALVTAPSPWDYYEPIVTFKKTYLAGQGNINALKEDEAGVVRTVCQAKDRFRSTSNL